MGLIGINPDFCLRAGRGLPACREAFVQTGGRIRISARVLCRNTSGTGGPNPVPFLRSIPLFTSGGPIPSEPFSPPRALGHSSCWNVQGRQGAARRRLLGPPPMAPRPPLRGLRSELGPPPPAAAGRAGVSGTGRAAAVRHGDGAAREARGLALR